MLLPSSRNILQINELIAVVNDKHVDSGKFCKLFVEMFEDLLLCPTALYCVEISRFCYALSGDEFEEKVQGIGFHDLTSLVSDGEGIYIYPQTFWPFHPEKVLEKAKEVSKKYPIPEGWKTLSEKIIDLKSHGEDAKSISRKLNLNPEFVEKAFVLHNIRKVGYPGDYLQSRFSLWFNVDWDNLNTEMKKRIYESSN